MRMFCPLHRLPLFEANNHICPTCSRLGIQVDKVELDKAERAIDTLLQQGQDIDYQRSFVVLVHKEHAPADAESKGA